MSTTNGYYPSPIKTRLSDSEPAPKGWKWVDLRDVARLESGHTPSRKVAEYWEGGDVPWLSLKDIRGMTSRYVMDTIDKPTMLGVDNSSARVLPKGTVAFCRTASVGNVAILGRDMATSQDFVDWVCGPQLLPEFLYEAFKASGPTFANEMQGSTHKTIYMPTVERFKILLPPLSEQKRIADILDKADAIRRKRQEAIGLTEQLIRSAFLDMFGDPVANQRQWPVKKLQDISTQIMSGTTPKGGKHVYPEEGITFFRSQNVWRNRIVLDDIAYIDEDTHRKMARSSLRNKDILITKTGRFNTENSSLGRAAMFMGQDDTANINGHVYLVRLKAEAIHEFVLFVLTMDEYREHIRRVCVGGIDKRQINKEHLEEFPIIAPPRNLQLRFAAIVKSHERQSERMKTQLAEANDLFNSLVQRAFKGEL